MDEIWFHLSSQLETLQVQMSLAVQQGQHWIGLWLTQARQVLQELYNDRGMEGVKNILQSIVGWIQRASEEIRFQCYNINFSTIGLYQQIKNSFGTEVSKKEVVFCLAGMAVGTLIGYYACINWGYNIYRIKHMKAVICHHYTGIEGVTMIEDAEVPTIKRSNELLIQVKAASINIVDEKICHGYSKIYRRLLNSGRHKDLPVTLGRDCAGIIVDIGEKVVDFEVGDEVFLAVPSWAPGTIAEYLVVPETLVVKRPKICSFELSASLPYSGCLAWDALVNCSTIQEGNAKGKRVLIYGGNTPVGCILTQLVKLWDGYVVTICGMISVRLLNNLGADEVIPVKDNNIEKELELQEKFDAIFYTGGEPIDERILKRYLQPFGSYVSTVPERLTSDSLGFISGSIFAGFVRVKLLVQYIFGFNMHQWKEGSKIKTAYLQALRDLANARYLQMTVDAIYAPRDVDIALEHLIHPESIGSTIITFQ